MPERVVFDTNIWISGLLWRGKPYQCLLLARVGMVQHVYCQEMTAELSQKLRQVFGFSENYIRAVLYDLRRISERVKIVGELHVVADDPDDDKFVECALVAAELDALYTHLYGLARGAGLHPGHVPYRAAEG